MTARAALLSDGRLHLHHGPIDLICQAWGTTAAIRAAYDAAAINFPSILPNLCKELAHLRSPLPTPRPDHPIARAMHAACTEVHLSWLGVTRPPTPFNADRPRHPRNTLFMHRGVGGRDKPGHDGDCFITPMAAVAGAIADHVLSVMQRAAPLQKAYVNNGGDIACYLSPGATLSCGIITTLAAPTLDAALCLTAENTCRGVATSGRACKGQGGRSFSLGIADSVTILAPTAAMADAAATIVGNAVNLDNPLIQRRPAHDIDPDSDLGPRLVTWSVPSLTPAEISKALDAGLRTADSLRRRGLIQAAFLALQGQFASQQPEPKAA